MDILKLNEAELAQVEGEPCGSIEDIVAAGTHLQRRGADRVLISRAAQPAVALVGERRLQLDGPRFEPLDERGAGDSLVAGLSVGVCRGLDFEDACRLGMAAGALNVTRHGLGSGRREDIERLAEAVHVRELR